MGEDDPRGSRVPGGTKVTAWTTDAEETKCQQHLTFLPTGLKGGDGILTTVRIVRAR